MSIAASKVLWQRTSSAGTNTYRAYPARPASSGFAASRLLMPSRNGICICSRARSRRSAPRTGEGSRRRRSVPPSRFALTAFGVGRPRRIWVLPLTYSSTTALATLRGADERRPPLSRAPPCPGLKASSSRARSSARRSCWARSMLSLTSIATTAADLAPGLLSAGRRIWLREGRGRLWPPRRPSRQSASGSPDRL